MESSNAFAVVWSAATCFRRLLDEFDESRFFECLQRNGSHRNRMVHIKETDQPKKMKLNYSVDGTITVAACIVRMKFDI